MNFNNKTINRTFNSRIDTRSLMSISDLKLDYDLKVGGYQFLPNTPFKTVLKRLTSEVNTLMSNGSADTIYSASGTVATDDQFVKVTLNNVFGIGYSSNEGFQDYFDSGAPGDYYQGLFFTGDYYLSNSVGLMNATNGGKNNQVTIGGESVFLRADSGTNTYGATIQLYNVNTTLQSSFRVYGHINSVSYEYYLPGNSPSATTGNLSSMQWTGTGSDAIPTFVTQPKKYVALLTQTGTNAPVATVLENTLGLVPSYSYLDVGTYLITATGKFTVNKTTTSIGSDIAISDTRYRVMTAYSDTDTMVLTSFNEATGTNGVLLNTLIEIRVYP